MWGLFFLGIILSYFLGSFNAAIILSKYLFGKDIRDYGSKNAGATNVFRVFGIKMGFFVFVLDALKGYLAVHLVYLFPNITGTDVANERIELQLCFGLAAVIGHVFPIFYNFKGGKGVATVLGIILGVNPTIALGLLAIFTLVVVSTNYVSLGSLLAAAAFPVLVVMFVDSTPVLFVTFAVQIALFIIYSHRKNIVRLIQGNENLFINRYP